MVPSKFSQWIRQNLKDAYSGLIAQDIDFVIKNSSGDIYFVEEKIFKQARTGPAQAVLYKLINDILKNHKSFTGCYKVVCTGENQLFVNDQYSLDYDFFEKEKAYFSNGQWYETVITNSLKYLWDGKGNPPCKKTEQERTFLRNSNLSSVLKKLNLKYFSIDWIVMNYVTGNFILLSEKKTSIDADVQNINQMFEDLTVNSGASNPKTKVVYEYLGHYVIDYNDAMTQFTLNNQICSSEDIINLLNLDDKKIVNYKRK